MLAAVERELSDEAFVAVGVHSPKFPTERDDEAVRDAVRRYGVTHPVLVDSGMAVWQQYGVRAWPTLVLVDPRGYVVGAGSGEPDEETLLRAIRRLLDDAAREGTLDPRPLPLRREPVPPGALAYPSKVAADGGRVAVADTGHDRIVLFDEHGAQRATAGDGEPGFVDGPLERARFRSPNGIAFARDALWVADTGNHAIRRVDLRAGSVETVAGTGERGRGLSAGGAGRDVALRSPWDVAWDGELLFIAMAGAHQIWTYDPATGDAEPFAGTGRELRIDGPASAAAFAQPSGLALLDGSLYVADSEISSVRAIDDLRGRATVRTVCGSGDLFGFGHRDGAGEEALLQHPIGMAAGGGALWVADTFNHAIKRVDPRTGECVTAFGTSEPERLPEIVPGAALRDATPGVPAFHEPEGLAWLGDTLLVADTNNHRVLAVSPGGARRVFAGS